MHRLPATAISTPVQLPVWPVMTPTDPGRQWSQTAPNDTAHAWLTPAGASLLPIKG